jgi:hypothetical protein
VQFTGKGKILIQLQQQLITSQKIKSTDYTSFSVLGLALTLSLGGIFIVVSYILEPVALLIQRRKKHKGYALLEWTLNETLQLQSLAHESQSEGNWTRSLGIMPNKIPITAEGDLLCPFDPRILHSTDLALVASVAAEQEDATNENIGSNESSATGNESKGVACPSGESVVAGTEKPGSNKSSAGRESGDAPTDEMTEERRVIEHDGPKLANQELN